MLSNIYIYIFHNLTFTSYYCLWGIGNKNRVWMSLSTNSGHKDSWFLQHAFTISIRMEKQLRGRKWSAPEKEMHSLPKFVYLIFWITKTKVYCTFTKKHFLTFQIVIPKTIPINQKREKGYGFSNSNICFVIT